MQSNILQVQKRIVEPAKVYMIANYKNLQVKFPKLYLWEIIPKKPKASKN